MENAAFRHLLVPVDGSPGSDVAVGFALGLAGRSCLVTFANAIDLGALAGEAGGPFGNDPSGILDALEAERKDVYAAARVQARAAGVEAETLDLAGAPASAIVAVLSRIGIDGVVMGTHGRSGLARAAIGSVAEAVIRHSPVPVFVLRGDLAPAAVPIRCVAVAVDGSPATTAAISTAATLAAAYRAKLVGIHIGKSDPETEKAYAALRDVADIAGVACDLVDGIGKPGAGIVNAAAAAHANLIAIGTHGRGGPARIVLGSVAACVMKEATVPVVVVGEKVAPLPARRIAQLREAPGTL